MPPKSVLAPPTEAVTKAVHDALAEDLGAGDVTSGAVIPEGARFKGTLAAREAMTVAGLACAETAFRALDPNVTWIAHVDDGAHIAPGTTIATVEGHAQALLSAERTALNLLQHLSGIATLTRAYVDAIAETDARLKDTRKTIPGLRALAKYATRCGGAVNHRMRLDDAVLIKDNHIAVAGSIAQAVAAARARGLSPIEVECDTLDQVREALDADADEVLLDNMDIPTLTEAVELAKGRAVTEASGGVNLDTIGAIAKTGVDFISVGRITQSAPAVDIGLDWALD